MLKHERVSKTGAQDFRGHEGPYPIPTERRSEQTRGETEEKDRPVDQQRHQTVAGSHSADKDRHGEDRQHGTKEADTAERVDETFGGNNAAGAEFGEKE